MFVRFVLVNTLFAACSFVNAANSEGSKHVSPPIVRSKTLSPEAMPFVPMENPPQWTATHISPTPNYPPTAINKPEVITHTKTSPLKIQPLTGYQPQYPVFQPSYPVYQTYLTQLHLFNEQYALLHAQLLNGGQSLSYQNGKPKESDSDQMSNSQHSGRSDSLLSPSNSYDWKIRKSLYDEQTKDLSNGPRFDTKPSKPQSKCQSMETVKSKYKDQTKSYCYRPNHDETSKSNCSRRQLHRKRINAKGSSSKPIAPSDKKWKIKPNTKSKKSKSILIQWDPHPEFHNGSSYILFYTALPYKADNVCQKVTTYKPSYTVAMLQLGKYGQYEFSVYFCKDHRPAHEFDMVPLASTKINADIASNSRVHVKPMYAGQQSF
eukprot:414904_1